jgi:hypothetical protein
MFEFAEGLAERSPADAEAFGHLDLEEPCPRQQASTHDRIAHQGGGACVERFSQDRNDHLFH